MTPLAPDIHPQEYVRTVLSLYRKLPETPLRPHSRDRIYAHQLEQRQLPLTLIETAFLLGSLRRLQRPPDAPPLSPIHSLAYFQPVIEELLHRPVPEGYVEYLRLRMQPFANKKISSRQQPCSARDQTLRTHDD